MKKRNIVIIMVVVIFCVSLMAPSAWAGPKQRHRWEGVAIGVGAYILGSALLNQHVNARHYWPPEPVYPHAPPPPPPEYCYTPPPRECWEIEKIWVPPAYKEVWNPDHYNKHGRWVPGRWIEIIDEPGYWRQERVLVTCR